MYREFDKNVQEYNEPLEYDEYNPLKPLNLKLWLLYGFLPLLLIIFIISKFILPLNGTLALILIVLSSLAIPKYLANLKRNKP